MTYLANEKAAGHAKRKSPHPPSFSGLREHWGIPAVPADPGPVEGPLVDGCDAYHVGVACPGSFRVTCHDGPVWTATCDVCRGETGVPARDLDPRIRRDGLLARAGLPELFSGPFERDEDNAPVLTALRQWLDTFDGSLKVSERPSSLLPAPALWGLPGRGKSHLLSVMCRRVIEECELPVAFVSARGLLHDLQRFDNDVIRGEAWERATTIEVLALDDLGAERTTEWRLEQLGHLIDERYQSELPILLASNWPPSQWEQRLDARTVSRLSQMTFPLELPGRDRRLASQSSLSEGAAV